MALLQRGTKTGWSPSFGFLGNIDTGLSERMGSWGTKLFGAPNPSVLSGGAAFYNPNNQSNAQNNQNTQPTNNQSNNYTSGDVGSSPIPEGQILGTNTFDSGGTSTGDNNIFDVTKENATQDSNTELERLLSAYDYNREKLETQRDYLGTQKDDAFSQLGLEETKLNQTVEGQKTQSYKTITREIQEAAGVANQVKSQNRNILRALGILASSAAAELLSRPMDEFAKERSRLTEIGIQRVNELDDYLNNGLDEIRNARTSVTNQFTKLTADIENDLRYNDRERLSAIEAANNALMERLNQIDMAALEFATQTQTTQNSILGSLNNITNYQNPETNTTAISGTTITPDTAYDPSQVGVSGADNFKRRTLSGLA